MNIISTQHNYTFKLTSALTKISLPYAIKNSSNLKIIFLKYTVATAGQELMLIKISHFNKHVFYDGTNIVKYAKAIALPPPGLLIYETSTDMNKPDVYAEERLDDNKGINNLTIEILIDNTFSTDITPLNPVYVELSIF